VTKKTEIKQFYFSFFQTSAHPETKLKQNTETVSAFQLRLNYFRRTKF